MTASAQHRKKHIGTRFAQRALGLLPDAFGHQRVHFTVAHHLLHQRHRVGMHGKTQRGETCGKTRHAQHPHGVFAKRFGHVAQRACGQVGLSAIGVDQRAIGGARHGIDRQVPPAQVFFQADVG